MRIFLLLIFICVRCCSITNGQTVSFLEQFENIKLPYSDRNLKNILFENDGRDIFDESLFDSLKIYPVKHEGIFSTDKKYYPVGKLESNTYSIIFAMCKIEEAGIIDPVIYAYIFDHKKGKLSDSLEIYFNYQWENLIKKQFTITEDSLITVREYEAFLPYYDITDNEDSLSIVEECEMINQYIIDKKTLKFKKISTPIIIPRTVRFCFFARR